MNKPNETSGLLLQGHIKIHDPNTGEVFVKVVTYVDKFWETKYLWVIFEWFVTAH